MNAEMRKILAFDYAITSYFLTYMVKAIEKKEMKNTPTKEDEWDFANKMHMF